MHMLKGKGTHPSYLAGYSKNVNDVPLLSDDAASRLDPGRLVLSLSQSQD